MLVTLLGRLAQFGIMFVSVKLMTTLMAPLQLGRAALITISVAFFAMFLVNPVGMFINRRLHAWYEGGRCRSYLHWYGLYIFLIASMGVLVFVSLSMINPGLFGLSWIWTIALVGGSLFFGTVVQTLIPSLNMLGRGLSFTVLNLSTLGLSLLLSYLFCTVGGASAEHWLAGTVAGQAILIGVAYWIFFKGYHSDTVIQYPSAQQWYGLLHFCWPLSIAVGLQWAHMQGYRYIVADQFGLEEFGLFAAGYGLAAAFLAAGETMLTTWFQPKFYRSANSPDKDERNIAWATYAARMIPATLLGCTALIATSNLLPKVMLGPQYHQIGNYVLLGCFAELGRILVGIFVLHAHQEMTTQKLILPNALGALISLFGLTGVIIFFDAGIMVAPILAALGCLAVIAMLWWVGLRKNKYAHLDVKGLLKQGISLFVAAVFIVFLSSDLSNKTTLDTSLLIILIYMVWIIFAFGMKNQLMENFVNKSEK